ncbi:MAG: GspE/PulE family protein [Hyphomicrobium sp.]|nr:GspE/PulE family protein [Hyphomicrobium sp.]
MVAEAKNSPADIPDPRNEGFVQRLKAQLIAGSLLDELGASRAERAARQSGERFDLALTRLGLVGEAPMADALSATLGLARHVDGTETPQRLFGDAVPQRFLSEHRFLILSDDGQETVVAVADPFQRDAIASLGFLIERRIAVRVATATEIEAALAGLVGTSVRTDAGDLVRDAEPAGEAAGGDDVRRLEDMASAAPIVRLVHDIIQRAADERASDIHIEPRAEAVLVRFRVDGQLRTVETLAPTVRAALASRIKIMARLDIAERRLPQDGRIKVSVRGREIDLRCSTMPTLGGESVVLRILDRSSIPLDFASLGFEGTELSGFRRLLDEPNGIILVTGPTGSGKTTTLYTALGTLNRPQQKLFTVEDPIEYQLAGVNQIHVNPKIGLTFASALRSILRQDPDIIMVGEIRDLETAEIAIRASLTGHLVLSTVHTNSAAATVTRLLDMGVEDYLLASSLKGVLAQRLVRRLCEACAEDTPASVTYEARLRSLAGAAFRDGATPRVRKACGCAKCQGTGFSGRTAIYELMTVTPGVRDSIIGQSNETLIETAAKTSGMRTLLENGVAKVLSGETTLDEVLRVTRAIDAALPL